MTSSKSTSALASTVVAAADLIEIELKLKLISSTVKSRRPILTEGKHVQTFIQINTIKSITVFNKIIISNNSKRSKINYYSLVTSNIISNKAMLKDKNTISKFNISRQHIPHNYTTINNTTFSECCSNTRQIIITSINTASISSNKIGK